jgi:hypothetical protein
VHSCLRTLVQQLKLHGAWNARGAAVGQASVPSVRSHRPKAPSAFPPTAMRGQFCRSFTTLTPYNPHLTPYNPHKDGPL